MPFNVRQLVALVIFLSFALILLCSLDKNDQIVTHTHSHEKLELHNNSIKSKKPIQNNIIKKNEVDINEAWGKLMHYITTVQYLCNDSRRMGNIKDGGWNVCMDVNIQPNKCIAYGVGVGHDWSFDNAMGEYGCNVYTFDPTIDEETHKHAERVWFYNIGLCDKDDDNVTSKSGRGARTWICRTLKSIKTMLDHEQEVIDVLKIDIEAHEMHVFPEILQSGILKDFKQILFELHIWAIPRHGRPEIAIARYDMLTDMLAGHGFKLFYFNENQVSPVATNVGRVDFSEAQKPKAKSSDVQECKEWNKNKF
ncbi:putative methyltransferase-like protein 24 [Saccoglossus kowalevskii]